MRELDNVIEHAMILNDGDWITPTICRARCARRAAAGAENDNLREALRA